MTPLIIRPLPAANDTASLATQAGLTPIVLPLFEIEPVPWNTPGAEAFDGLFFSSANAVRHGGDGLKNYHDLPVVAVGAVTAKEVQPHGFNVALTGDDDKAGILAQARRAGFEKLLWLGGKHRTGKVPDEDIIAQRISVYAAAELAPPPDFAEQFSRSDVTMLHSPRAARYFRTLLDDLGVQISAVSIAALSSAVARAAGDGWKRAVIADRPSDDALLQAAQALLD